MSIFGNKEICKECGKEFKNSGQLEIHMEANHPSAPKPPPPTTDETEVLSTSTETFRLEGGKGKINVGSVFVQERTVLVRKVTVSPGSNLVVVEGEIIKKCWNPPTI